MSLQATDLRFAYGRSRASSAPAHGPHGRGPAIDGVSVDIPDGGLVGLLGPNGSGRHGCQEPELDARARTGVVLEIARAKYGFQKRALHGSRLRSPPVGNLDQEPGFVRLAMWSAAWAGSNDYSESAACCCEAVKRAATGIPSLSAPMRLRPPVRSSWRAPSSPPREL